jgi:predicted amidohydrolase YtcJ
MNLLSRTVLLILLATFGLKASAQSPAPDRIFHGGVVLTMAENGMKAEALALHSDSILAVGSNNEILALGGPETALIDLFGAALLPGFVDAHSHLFSEAENQGMTFLQAQGVAFRFGVTTLANLYTTRQLADALIEFDDTGRLRLRTSLYLSRTDYCGEDLGEWYLDLPPSRDRDGPLRIGGIKIFTDGGTCGQPATSFESRGSFGDLWRSQSDFNGLIQSVDARGYQMAIHAVGDRAVHQALNGLEWLLDGRTNMLRHRLEHNSFVAQDDLERYGQLGIPFVITGSYATCAETRFGALSNLYGDNVRWFEDWRSVLDANPDLGGWHSDYPFLVLDPIRHLFSYVTRIELDPDRVFCEPPDWLVEHTVSVEEGLQLMTRGAAYAMDWDEHVGSLEPGKLADLVVLSQDPTAVDARDIIDTRILSTWVGGSLAYCQKGSEALCGLPVTSQADQLEKPGPLIRGHRPSPIFATGEIDLEITTPGHVIAAVFDITGRRVSTLVDTFLPSGDRRLVWDARSLAPGLYFLRVSAQDRIEVRKIVIAR